MSVILLMIKSAMQIYSEKYLRSDFFFGFNCDFAIRIQKKKHMNRKHHVLNARQKTNSDVRFDLCFSFLKIELHEWYDG